MPTTPHSPNSGPHDTSAAATPDPACGCSPDADAGDTAALSRRRFLRLGGGALGAAGVAGAIGGTQLAFADPADPSRGDIIVVIFLEGGADGLTLFPPFTEGRYYDRRPSLAVPPPGQQGGALDLNGTFGMHPVMRPLFDGPWTDGNLAVIQATGFGEEHPSLRSHFAAQEFNHRGTTNPDVRSGWLARYLHFAGLTSGVPAVSISGGRIDENLSGFEQSYGLVDLDQFRLDGFYGSSAQEAAVRQAFSNAYGGHDAPLGRAGATTLGALQRVESSGAAAIATANGADYPNTRMGQGLADIARLARADVGLQVATIGTGTAWDSHSGQAGDLPQRMTDLSQSLRAFYDDLGPLSTEVTVIVDTEFGRTTEENGSAGTDHGKGGSMMVMGRSVNGGVYADWPTLADNDGDPDLRVTRDYRSVMTEVFTGRGNPADMGRVFPGFTPQAPLGLV